MSSPSLNASKWVYGILIGVKTVIIRAVNPAYAEGVMLSILLMNVFAPLIDHVLETSIESGFQMSSNVKTFIFAIVKCVWFVVLY